MNLDYAIDVLLRFRDEGSVDLPLDVEPAINLGIEALKRIDDQRNAKVLPFDRWLPGETED